MKEEFEKYLDSIELSSTTVKENIEKILQYTSKICREEITDLFVSDSIRENGERDYGSLWLFTKEFLLEARNFRSTVDYDIDVSHLKDNLSYYRTRIKDFDLSKASDDSRMKVECINYETINFELEATRNNCEKLMLIMSNLLINYM